MNVELPIEGMTWGELRDFVALADGVPDDAEVCIVSDEASNYAPAAIAVVGINVKRVDR